jgi:hypothetical protein
MVIKIVPNPLSKAGDMGGGVLTFTFIGNQLFLAIKNIFKKFVLSFLGAFCHRGMLEFFKSA